jgi:hypothetical protein
VPFNLRSQAIAWYSVIARALGSIPGPIFFGAILDTACVVWEPEEVDVCEPTDKFKAGSCMLFNSRSTSYMWLGMFLITRVLNGLLLILMHFFAKQRSAESGSGIELDGGVDKDNVDNDNVNNDKTETVKIENIRGNVNSSYQ